MPLTCGIIKRLIRFIRNKYKRDRMKSMIDLKMAHLRHMFDEVTLKRGIDIYQKGQVYGLKETVEEGMATVKCQVLGATLSEVLFCEVTSGQLSGYCSCHQFAKSSCCKHMAAAMVAYVREYSEKNVKIQSDRYVTRVLESYIQQADPPKPPLVPAKLVPSIRFRYGAEYPTITFRVGQEKLYVVKDIQKLLESVQKGETVALGKNYSLNHSIGQFDQSSSELIRILMNEYSNSRSNRWGTWGNSRYYSEDGKNEITLRGEAFDRFFCLMEGQTVDGGGLFITEDPRVTVSLEKEAGYARLSLETYDSYHAFGNHQSLYMCSGSRLIRCSEEFRTRVYPLLENGHPVMEMAFEDIPTFCGCVLPKIQGHVEIKDPDELIRDHLPEDCDTCFYFDMEEDRLTLRISFRYGEAEVSAGQSVSSTPNIRRNIRREQQASILAENYFDPESDPYEIEGQDRAYAFLTEHLEAFREVGEVYISERLQGRQVSSSQSAVGISLSDGMLLLDLNTGDFPPEELEALYQSMLKRKKYHRLEDGRFLPLDGSSYEKLAEMAHMLQLSPKDLKKGELKVPAFRALYLDNVLGKEDSLRVTRDRQFRRMIRDFKAVEESDFTVPENLESVLRPYQKTGFRWLKTLESCGFGGILADEMGLGKTVQAIAFLASLKREETKAPSLIVCPTSLILNWGEEFAKFAPELRITMIYGTASERKQMIVQEGQGDVWITSYELLRQDVAQYEGREFYTCILDEAQHIKNQSTLISKAVKTINCRQRFVLTGTPVENRLSELWNLFDFLMPGYLFSHRTFVEKLEKPIIKSKNAEASDQLRRLAQPFLLRRLKQDVLKELPPKIEHIHRIPLGEIEKRTYYSAVHALKNSLGDTGKLQILAGLTQLRRICCDPNLSFENYEGETAKLDACMELCEEMVSNGHQILLFSQFTSMLDILRSRLNAMGISNYTIQGSTPKEERAKLVKKFNQGGAKVFLISLKAGGTGLNLTSADVVIHYDPWWNQAAQNQATDRAHRIGQSTCVHVYKLIAQGTIEEKILDLQERKAALLNVVSGDNDTAILDMSKEELLQLLEV